MDRKEQLQGIWAVVPVKRFDQAKKRLSSVLDAGERRSLSIAMLGDVLEALSKASNICGTMVVTCEREAMNMTSSYGAEILSETNSRGLSKAVKTAGQFLDARGCAGVISIPGDVPLVCAEEIDRIIDNHGTAPAVTIVPAWDGGGTNALMCTPADVISLQYGEDSFSAHKNAALSVGLEPTVVPSLGLALDLDTPDDLPAFLERKSETRTARFLESIRVSERFGTNLQIDERRLG